jgi:hypothetical protein
MASAILTTIDMTFRSMDEATYFCFVHFLVLDLQLLLP